MATHTDDISRVYAEALLAVVRQAGGEAALQETADELEALVEVMRADRSFREFLATPIIDTKAREAALKRILGGRVSENLLRLILLLNRKRRLGKLASVAAAYDQALQESFGKVEVDVYTVDGKAPEAEVQQTMRQRIQAALRREPVFHFYADRHMIGGVKLRIGDQLVDGSVATRLRRMRTNIIERGGDAIREDIKKFLG